MTLNDRITEAKKSNDGRPHVPEGDAGTTVFISQMDKIIKKKTYNSLNPHYLPYYHSNQL